MASPHGTCYARAGAYAERVGSTAVGFVYLLAGVPETVELCLSVAGGQVDTHVLMTLAALGLLALGQASEVSPGNGVPS